MTPSSARALAYPASISSHKNSLVKKGVPVLLQTEKNTHISDSLLIRKEISTVVAPFSALPQQITTQVKEKTASLLRKGLNPTKDAQSYWDLCVCPLLQTLQAQKGFGYLHFQQKGKILIQIATKSQKVSFPLEHIWKTKDEDGQDSLAFFDKKSEAIFVLNYQWELEEQKQFVKSSSDNTKSTSWDYFVAQIAPVLGSEKYTSISSSLATDSKNGKLHISIYANSKKTFLCEHIWKKGDSLEFFDETSNTIYSIENGHWIGYLNEKNAHTKVQKTTKNNTAKLLDF